MFIVGKSPLICRPYVEEDRERAMQMAHLFVIVTENHVP